MPQLYIVKGKLLLQLLTEQYRASVASEAQESFENALHLARSQEAKMLELQAVISLSQLWRLQGKKEAAQCLLAQTYDWFTEGFDSPDLQQAKALLQKWGRTRETAV